MNKFILNVFVYKTDPRIYQQLYTNDMYFHAVGSRYTLHCICCGNVEQYMAGGAHAG